MKAREIFLVLLIIGIGVFTYYAKTGKLDIEWDGSDWSWLLPGEEFVFEETQEITAPLPPEIQVINSHGSVEIQGVETEKISISFKKSIYRKNKEEAQKVADKLKMAINREEPRLILSTNRNEFQRKNFETHFKISVPAGTEVVVKNSYGLVKTVKTKNAHIANSHGEVQALDIGGQLIISNSYEDVTIINVEADCRVTSRHSKVSATNVQGELVLDHSYGEVELENIGKKVSLNGSYSRLTGKVLKGEVEVESSYRPIILSEAGPTTIRGRHSDIEAKGISGPLEIMDTYAQLRLNNIKGNLKIEGTNMEIWADSVLADEIFVTSSYENVEILSFKGKTTVLLTHGDLALEPESVTGPIDVQASYASIRFGWPAGGKFPFEARTKSGNIQWNLADKPSLEETNGQSVTKAFLDESGKPSIRLSTSYGDIRVEETSRSLKSI